MGIYPETKISNRVRHEDGTETWTETLNNFDGAIRTRTVTAGEWNVERTDCFCCSCGDREGSDPACRNHGWAAKRPCDVHNLPGSEWDDEEGGMPEPVSLARASYNH
jgi:hypothetical protein